MMKKWTRYIFLMSVLLAQAFSSCSLIDEPEYDNSVSVKASLAFMVSRDKNNSTRMADNVVQEQPSSGQSYRGLGNVYMIPFAISGDADAIVTSSDHPSRLFEGDTASPTLSSFVPKAGVYGGFYLCNTYSMMRGVNAFLVYGKAAEISGVTGKASYGSLVLPDNLTTPDLANMRFTLEPISSQSAPDEASLLAGYLNHIAKAKTGENGVSWKDTTVPKLKEIYLFFTGQQNAESMVMAGSSVNVMAHVNALYDKVKPLSYADNASEGAKLQNAILDGIKGYSAPGLTLTVNDAGKLTGLSVNYPASVGLPDGAAALRWVKSETSSEYEFEPRFETTTQDNINNISRFTYPAELFYYVNSRIDTSNRTVGEDVYNSSTDWADVCSQYQYQPGTVTINTRSVAIHDPLQYAVGRLKMSMIAETATETLKDAAGEGVPLTNPTTSKSSFPLTGVIVCNQHPVDFNFKPVLVNGAASHVDDCFIYDSQVKKSDNTYCYLTTTEESNIPSTLVLQTYDTGEGNDKKGPEEVTIVMEFLNQSGQAFAGKNSIIYPDTKFYLIGKVNPLEASSANAAPEAVGRVFTQDHVTTVNTKVSSLANAYNVLPDLIGGRLELGVELVSSWVQAEPTNVILK